ncbi:hypothetical protein ACQEU8_20985 [Streptomyces sp. CA-250714]|uniref:hypothetical protein n=1 Tax=Streptomyces sp. CA-250714 TaxID=3240060 RepID=UPI003D8C8369
MSRPGIVAPTAATETGVPGFGEDWPVRVATLFSGTPGLLLAATAARSAAFARNDAAVGNRVLIGSAAGFDRTDVVARARGGWWSGSAMYSPGGAPRPGRCRGRTRPHAWRARRGGRHDRLVRRAAPPQCSRTLPVFVARTVGGR